MKIKKCFNCKALPVITENTKDTFKITLKHDPATCPFRWEISHHSKEQVIHIWNQYQIKPL